uniref:Chromatin modification-related protein MEAF6 n=1 Tax=Angiostrongylus cantonensis TaxID=6313 RepID=A0A0K0D7L2_ANGCA
MSYKGLREELRAYLKEKAVQQEKLDKLEEELAKSEEDYYRETAEIGNIFQDEFTLDFNREALTKLLEKPKEAETPSVPPSNDEVAPSTSGQNGSGDGSAASTSQDSAKRRRARRKSPTARERNRHTVYGMNITALGMSFFQVQIFSLATTPEPEKEEVNSDVTPLRVLAAL